MMEILKEMTRNLVLLLLLATFLEMLLPKSDFSRYIRLVVGLFVLLTILQPFMELFDWQGKVSLGIREPPQEQLEVIINQGLLFGEHRQAMALQVAEERLEQQVEAMLYLVQGIDRVKVDLTLENNQETGPVITKATIMLTPTGMEDMGSQAMVQEVEAVAIGVNRATQPASTVRQRVEPEVYSRLVERVINGVSNYLGLEKARVQVNLATD